MLSLPLIKHIRKWIGYCIRGVFGYVQNTFEKIPSLPSDLQLKHIGTSVEQRPIQCFQIGNGSRHVLFAFGIHGNEVGTVKLAHFFIHWAFIHAKQREQYTISVIPSLNPDGYARAQENPDYLRGGKIGRFNAHDVDLNRNFPVPSFQKTSVWSFGKEYSENTEVYCGEHGGSEPEVAALTTYIKENEIQTVYMFHNAGADVMANNNEFARATAKRYAEESGFRYVSNDDWAILGQTGTAREWCDLQGIAYVEIEGSTRWGSDWKKQKNAIQQTLLYLSH